EDVALLAKPGFGREFAGWLHHYAELHGRRIEQARERAPGFCGSFHHVARIGGEVQRESGRVKRAGERKIEIAKQGIKTFGLHGAHQTWIACTQSNNRKTGIPAPPNGVRAAYPEITMGSRCVRP